MISRGPKYFTGIIIYRYLYYRILLLKYCTSLTKREQRHEAHNKTSLNAFGDYLKKIKKSVIGVSLTDVPVVLKWQMGLILIKRLREQRRWWWSDGGIEHKSETASGCKSKAQRSLVYVTLPWQQPDCDCSFTFGAWLPPAHRLWTTERNKEWTQ